VLGDLSARLSNKEIAERLSISPHTVKRHTNSLYQKLGVQGRRQAVARARMLGLLPSP
jgi:ATP/maltotriose-dependent transcriptional regulator MalT